VKKVYNKYIGNTGKFVRVEDHPGGIHPAHRPAAKPTPLHQPTQAIHQAPQPVAAAPPAPPAKLKNKPLFGGLGSGLSSLLGGSGSLLGGGSSGLLGGLGNGFKGLSGMFDNLPFGLDIGDILLFLMLLFLFLESGDEEFIIILAVIAFSLFKER